VKSTTGFPAASTEHIKVGYFYVPSATRVQSDSGPFANQNWNDERAGTGGYGHVAHMGEKIRYGIGVTYRSGLDITVDIQTVGGGLDDVYLSTTSGLILQMHEQTITAKDMETGDDAHVINDPVTANAEINNLNQITTDSTGASLTNRYFNLFVAMACNKTGQYQPTRRRVYKLKRCYQRCIWLQC
jgi:hypothetical protein